MSYLDQDDPNLIEDLLLRKEFVWFKKWGVQEQDDNIIPRFMLSDIIKKNGYLRFLGHQMFVRNFINPNTNYKRVHIKWSTGSGKTLGGLAIAMNFIRNYKLEKELGNQEIGSVFIIGFSERAFKNELLRYPEFGFLSRDERIQIDKLKRLALTGSIHDREKLRELVSKIKRRFSNRKRNGFFKFIGYKAFVNKLLLAPPGTNIGEMSEENIRLALASGKIKFNESLLADFRNSLIICDEIHNVYNSSEKNNWGIAIQAILDKEPSVRFVSLSATPLNNSPAEIIDLLNLLIPKEQRVERNDFFYNDRTLKPGALEKIAELARGRFSFLMDTNPKHYPKIINIGESLNEIPYLKFIRCPMSKFHYNTYKAFYNGALSQDSQYLVDFALPNPESTDVGLFQTQSIKKLIPFATQKFKSQYGIDYKNGKLMGDFMHADNIATYSTKYARVLAEIFNDIKDGHGKIFIYHNTVHISGVLFIEQMLIKNGFLDEQLSSSDNTVCMRCGKVRKEHPKESIIDGGSENELYIGDKLIAKLNLADNFYYNESQDISILNGENTGMFIDFINRHENLPIFITFRSDIGQKLQNELLNAGFTYYSNDSSKTTLSRTANTTKPVFDTKLDSQFSNKVSDKSCNQDNPIVVGGAKIYNHKFTPARFIMAHSDIDKSKMEHSIERFNSIDNIDGSQYLILVGSKIIKESYDIKALQNVYITSKPDNIPTFIQIRGRAVRKDSHNGLPEDQHVVRVKIFTTCLPENQMVGVDKGKYKLSYEEEKYKEKILAFQTIQKIEKVIHENAIDTAVNYEKNTKNMDDVLGPIPFKNNSKAINPAKLIKSTFNVYYAKEEVELIQYIIKRLFIEISSVWEYKDLWESVQKTPDNYDVYVNTRLFSENNFIIAINLLLWNIGGDYVDAIVKKIGGNEPDIHNYTEIDPLTQAMISLQDSSNNTFDNTSSNTNTHSGGDSESEFSINNLFNPVSKIISLPNGQDNIIISITNDKKQYYILFPFKEKINAPDIDIELPYRITLHDQQKRININQFMQTKRIDFDYDDKKRIFYRRYADTSIENMQNVVCEYGTSFHIKFIEECIEYVFRAWTDPNLIKHEFHDFYFKMIYYYDLLSLVLWAYTSKPRIFKDYIKYAIPIHAKDIKLKILDKYESRKDELGDISPDDNSDLATSGIINLLKSTYNRTSNAWIPTEFRENYNKTLTQSLALFQGRKKKSKYITKIKADMLPIGHYISKFPRLFHPERGWDENSTYLHNEQDFKENDIIVGFDERSDTGVHIRFKIRHPIHNIPQYSDSRKIEKGTVCKSKSKDELKLLAKKLDVVLPDKVNVDDLCLVIRSKLIRLELKERIKKSNIKYFYFFYEERPETII